MNVEVVATVLSAVGVLLAVWRMLAAYETRNDQAHAALTARIDRLYELLLERLPKAPMPPWNAGWPPALFSNAHLSDAELLELHQGEQDFRKAVEDARQSRTHPPF